MSKTLAALPQKRAHPSDLYGNSHAFLHEEGDHKRQKTSSNDQWGNLAGLAKPAQNGSSGSGSGITNRENMSESLLKNLLPGNHHNPPI